ncbi:MAG TPA: glycosyltransferase, partial [Caulobacteraceae bacterium]|nr:glycosyltransferase [Caulobacteraceae bacterium]
SQGPAALITDEVDGLLVAIDDEQALAKAAGRLIKEPGLGARLAQAGAARVDGEFSKASVLSQWRALLGAFGAV